MKKFILVLLMSFLLFAMLINPSYSMIENKVSYSTLMPKKKANISCELLKENDFIFYNVEEENETIELDFPIEANAEYIFKVEAFNNTDDLFDISLINESGSSNQNVKLIINLNNDKVLPIDYRALKIYLALYEVKQDEEIKLENTYLWINFFPSINFADLTKKPLFVYYPETLLRVVGNVKSTYLKMNDEKFPAKTSYIVNNLRYFLYNDSYINIDGNADVFIDLIDYPESISINNQSIFRDYLLQTFISDEAIFVSEDYYSDIPSIWLEKHSDVADYRSTGSIELLRLVRNDDGFFSWDNYNENTPIIQNDGYYLFETSDYPKGIYKIIVNYESRYKVERIMIVD